MSSFPFEILLMIFQWATYVPYAFDTHALDPFAYPGPPTQEQIQKSILRSFHTRRSLVLVCKAWNALATPFLYETIPICGGWHLEMLVRTLSDSSTDPLVPGMSSSGSSRVRKTVRLDMVLPIDAYLSWDSFVKLLRALPNLQIIVSRRGLPYFLRPALQREHLTFPEVLSELCTKTLHVLDIGSEYHLERDGWSKLPAAINGQPLRVLKIRSIRMPKCDSARERQQYVVPAITLSLPDIEHLHLPWRVTKSVVTVEPLPRRLSHVFFETDLEMLESLFDGSLSRICHQVTSLDIDDTFISTESDDFTHLLLAIEDSCPKLKRLIFSRLFPDAFFPKAGVIPSTVESLGLRFYTVPEEKEKNWFESVERMLVRLNSWTLNADVVRILGEPTPKESREYRKIVSRSLKYSHVRIEDRMGRRSLLETFRYIHTP